MANSKDFAAAKSAPARQQERETLIDWARVGDALRGTTRRASDAALDAALGRTASPPPAPPAPPVIVRDGGGGDRTLAWILGLAVAGLALGAVMKR